MRVALFFDGKNFYSGWRASTEGATVDFAKLSQWLVQRVEGSRLWGAYYYTGVERGDAADNDSQRKLVEFLDTIELLPGYFVQRFPRRTRTAHCPSCGEGVAFSQETEVDTTIVADMLRLAAVDAFDVAVLVSGDADLAPAVEGVRLLGKQVYVATWGGSQLSPRIRSLAFDRIDLRDGAEAFCEGGAEAVVSRGYLGTETIEELTEPFLEELARAEGKMQEGYVGLNFFLKRWRSAILPEDQELRSRVLKHLVEHGEVDIYEAVDGNKAIRQPILEPQQEED